MLAPASQMSWKFWSTPESIASETPSVMAITETVIAVGAYWYYAIHFDNYALLIVSIAFAPLVLLRSNESIALGVEWFLAFEEMTNREIPNSRPTVQHVFSKIATVVVGFSPCTICASFYLFFAYPDSGVGTLALLVTATALGTALYTLCYFARFGYLMLIALFCPWVLLPWSLTLSHILVCLLVSFGFFFPTLTAMLGLTFSLPALLIRTAATARHIGEGIKCLPANFRRLVLARLRANFRS
jgi:hypothetical protein